MAVLNGLGIFDMLLAGVFVYISFISISKLLAV
jgi:hypothetical protein